MLRPQRDRGGEGRTGPPSAAVLLGQPETRAGPGGEDGGAALYLSGWEETEVSEAPLHSPGSPGLALPTCAPVLPLTCSISFLLMPNL